MSLITILSKYCFAFQRELIPTLEKEPGPLGERYEWFVTEIGFVQAEQFLWPCQSRLRHAAYSASQPCLSLEIVAGESPLTDSPNSASSASSKSFIDTPFRYSHGITASRRRVFFRYGGSDCERKHRP